MPSPFPLPDQGPGPEANLGPGLEDDLVRRCQAGDPQAFEEMVCRYGDEVYRLACRVLRDPVLAQDVAQETFLAVYRRIGQYGFRARFRHWLRRVTVNLAITHLRRIRSARAVEPGEVLMPAAGPWEPEEWLLAREAGRRMRRALETLDPVYRLPVWLKYYCNLSDAEIARVLRCPEGTVKSRLHRARQVLRRTLGDPAALPAG